ncbi:MAG TPA: nucleoside deaminase [Burkholderiaceae bacterium]
MTIEDDDSLHLRAAIEASRQARARGDMPFGAVLVKDGRALLTAMNNQNSARDCTGHAEIVLVREAQQALGAAALAGATVYASGEPCAMCAGAMFWAGVARVVYAASTPQINAALGGAALAARCADVLAGASPPVVVAGPLLEQEAVAVLAAGAARFS